MDLFVCMCCGPYARIADLFVYVHSLLHSYMPDDIAGKNYSALPTKINWTIHDSIVNRGKWLGSLAKFFVLCFCSLFWP